MCWTALVCKCSNNGRAVINTARTVPVCTRLLFNSIEPYVSKLGEFTVVISLFIELLQAYLENCSASHWQSKSESVLFTFSGCFS